MYHFRARLQDVRRLLERAGELELSATAVQRLKWFAFALEHDGNVSLTCRHFGVARSTFLRWARRFDARRIESLEEQSRRPHTVRKSEVAPHVVGLIEKLRREQPLIGKQEIAEILTREYGIQISSSSVGHVIARHCFFFADTPAHRQKRLNAGIDSAEDAQTPEGATQEAEHEMRAQTPPEPSTDQPSLFPLDPEPGPAA